MIKEPHITVFLPTMKPSASKHFYSRKLGLKLISEDNYALEFSGHGSTLRITTVTQFNPQPFTVLGFRIEDVVSYVRHLNKKGVTFERFDALDQDELGIWTSPGNAKVAWFKDPDENLISLTQMPDK